MGEGAFADVEVEVLGHLVLADHLADAQGDLVGATQRAPVALGGGGHGVEQLLRWRAAVARACARAGSASSGLRHTMRRSPGKSSLRSSTRSVSSNSDGRTAPAADGRRAQGADPVKAGRPQFVADARVGEHAAVADPAPRGRGRSGAAACRAAPPAWRDRRCCRRTPRPRRDSRLGCRAGRRRSAACRRASSRAWRVGSSGPLGSWRSGRGAPGHRRRDGAWRGAVSIQINPLSTRNGRETLEVQSSGRTAPGRARWCPSTRRARSPASSRHRCGRIGP